MIEPGEAAGRRYDLIAIGSGMGGAAAALRASTLGLRAAIVEKGALGGTCVNVGCVPTKYLLRVAEEVSDVRGMLERGLLEGSVRPRLAGIMARKRELIDQVIAWYLDYVFPSYEVDVIRGEARLRDPHTVVVDGVAIEARSIVVATGSEPVVPPIKGLDEALRRGYALTSDGALALEEAPEHLIVIGGGPVGVELATVWRGFGSRVTIVEIMPRILPGMDPDVSKSLTEILGFKGVEVITGSRVTAVDAERGEVRLEDGRRIQGDRVLVATGRRPSTRGLGLEEVGVELGPHGEVLVDDHARTSVPSIYAVGDVTGEPYVASKAKIQGIAAGENAAGLDSRYDASLIPMAVYSDPEAAGVGVSARKGDPGYIVKRFPAAVNYRAIASERPYGIAKIVARESDRRIVGFHMVGLNASEVVNVAAVAIKLGLTVDEARDLVFSHPVMSEVFLDNINLLLGINVYLPRRG